MKEVNSSVEAPENLYSFVLKKLVELSKTPFALSLSKGERGFGSHLMGEVCRELFMLQ